MAGCSQATAQGAFAAAASGRITQWCDHHHGVTRRCGGRWALGTCGWACWCSWFFLLGGGLNLGCIGTYIYIYIWIIYLLDFLGNLIGYDWIGLGEICAASVPQAIHMGSQLKSWCHLRTKTPTAWPMPMLYCITYWAWILIWKNKCMFLLVWAWSYWCIWEINVLIRVLSTHVFSTVGYVTTGSMWQYGKIHPAVTEARWKKILFLQMYFHYRPSHNHGSVKNVCNSNSGFRSNIPPFLHWIMIMGERVIDNKTLLLGDGCEIGRFWVLNYPPWS